uniref:hypothetical protein n=1 Tax=Nonomuraea pusilla TaxID=46177 RepID=UPI00128F0312|nr:hypothetical protein [Nonomuraea pusilla]
MAGFAAEGAIAEPFMASTGATGLVPAVAVVTPPLKGGRSSRPGMAAWLRKVDERGARRRA